MVKKSKNFLKVGYESQAHSTTPKIYISAFLVLTFTWLLNCAAVLNSYWSGDDWPNSQTPYWIMWRFGSVSKTYVLEEALFWNNQWMNGAGRFYPIHWIESRFIFSYLTGLWQYKFLQSLALFIAGMLFTYIVYLFSKSQVLAFSTLFFLSLTVQFRRDFDPHIAYALMLPSILIKIIIGLIFSYTAGKSHRFWRSLGWSSLSGIFLFLAMSTYEFAFLLFPTFIFAYFVGVGFRVNQYNLLHNKKFLSQLLHLLRLLPIIGSWLAYGVFVFGYLRPNATSISGTYLLGLSWKSISVFFSQALMGFPTISFRYSDLDVTVPTFLLLFLVFMAIKNSFISYFLTSNSLKVFRNYEKIQIKRYGNSKSNSIYISLISLNFILAPGLMMAMQPTWWERANLAQSYLGVMITEFGTALLLAIFVNLFVRKNFLVKLRS